MVKPGTEVLGIAEDLCRHFGKPPGSLRFLVKGERINPFSATHLTMDDINLIEQKKCLVWFVPSLYEDTLAHSGMEGLVQALDETESNLELAEKVSRELSDHNESLGNRIEELKKSVSTAQKKFEDANKERNKLRIELEECEKDRVALKRRIKHQKDSHRGELKKLQFDKSKVQKELDQKCSVLKDVVTEKDNLAKSRRDLQGEVQMCHKQLYVWQKWEKQQQKARANLVKEKEESDKEVAYLRDRLKMFSTTQTQTYRFDASHRLPSSTPSDAGNESVHSSSDHYDHSSSVSQFEQSPTTSCGSFNSAGSSKLTIIDDAHYGPSGESKPKINLDQNTPRYENASTYSVSSVQTSQLNPSAKPFIYNSYNHF